MTVLTNPGLDDGSDEWQVANAAWVKFWQWRDRAVQVGDNIDEMARNYFTYYYEQNKEKRLEYDREYRERKKEQLKAYRQKYYEKQKEKKLEEEKNGNN